MSVSFLVPAFLAGLLALAIPILVHLSRRQTRDPVPFPSLMFLARVPQQTTEKRRIHRWPLLLLRSLAVILLVLAFSRPFLERQGESSALPATGDRELVVLVDRSYSMGLGDRWQRAIAAADATIEGMAGGDRATLVFFDSGAESATESTTDRSVLRTALRTAEPGPRTTRYAPGLRYASRLLGSSPLPRHELVVISDFQQSAWDRDGGETSAIRLPPGTVVTPISVAEVDAGVNVAVTGADFDRSVSAGRERVAIVGRLSGPPDLTATVPVTLEVDGRAVETRQAALAGGSATVGFGPLTLPEAGATRGTLRIPADALAIDNEFHFVLSADQRLGVLIVEGPGTARQSSFFLERALAIGASPGFRAEVRRGSEIRAQDLAENPVVILNQVPFPGGEQGDRLRRHVEQGGGLVLLLGENSAGSWPGVLPNVGNPVDRVEGGGVSLGYIDTGHPVFDAFAGPRSGDFGAARIYRYRSLPSGAFPRVLARFGDGGAALAERTVGDGRVLVWTSTLDGVWNDLTVQPVFLPFLHQLVKYAAGYTPPRSWLSVGDPYDPRGLLPAGEEYTVALTPTARQLDLAPGVPVELGEVGFYELRDPRIGGRQRTLAVNVDASESDGSPFDPEEMRSALLAGATEATSASGRLTLSLAERERGQSAWWYLLVVVFALLIAETWFSNRRGEGPGAGRAWMRWRRTTERGDPRKRDLAA
jgi:hypothetical protein